jgi:hypothetical protein
VTPSRRLLAIVSVGSLVACAGRTGLVTPAPTPEATVEQFLGAVNANSPDRMEQLFGDETGDQHWRSPTDRQERLAIFQRLLQCDSLRVLGTEPDSLGNATRRLVRVELVRGERRVRVPFAVAQQRAGGWLVYGFDMTPLMPAPAGRRRP